MATEADKHHLKNHGYVVFQLLSPQEAQIAKQHIQSTLSAIFRFSKCVCKVVLAN